jgi:signal transduction histidine kinase/ActR/RegA family two-component response regulator
MGALLVIVSATLLLVRVRDQKELLEAYALGFAKTTNNQLCSAWRLYYRSGAYKFRDIIRNTMGLNEDLHRLFILSVSGEVLFDSMESPDLMLLPEIPRRRLADEDLVTVAGLQEAWSERRDLEGVGPVLMVSTPYFEEWGRHPYSVLYIFKYDKVWERVVADLGSTLLVVLLALGSVAFFASWIAGSVARPLLTLTEGVRSFSEGKLTALPAVSTGDEIETLADAFNRMAERIQQQVERLETANRELATLDRMKTDLLANVSHELRTPLAAIRGYVEFIQEGQLGPTTEAQREGLEVCLRNSERLTKTINMLLDFSRMELGRVPVRPAPFQIGRLVAQIVSGIEADARKRRIRIRTVVERDLKPVDGDRDRLTQVLENLITNALKFTPDEGEVEVGAKPTPDGKRMEVWVADTGIGIPPAERARVFDKFYQADGSATRRFGGIGLGLAIVKSILDAHGTEIVVDGRPGSGSVFRFSLPVVEAHTESGVFHGLLPPQEDGPADVLAIDDDPDFLAILRETLEKHGFTVRTAETAAEGLAAAREKTPYLIILDIRLPDRDGLDLLHELREDDATRRTPILVASVVDERLEGLRLGAVEYLVKPIDRSRLVEAASRAIRARAERPPSGETPAASPA